LGRYFSISNGLGELLMQLSMQAFLPCSLQAAAPVFRVDSRIARSNDLDLFKSDYNNP
jgi:hypothetical protein